MKARPSPYIVFSLVVIYALAIAQFITDLMFAIMGETWAAVPFIISFAFLAGRFGAQFSGADEYIEDLLAEWFDE